MILEELFENAVYKLKSVDFVEKPGLEARIFLCDVLLLKPSDFFMYDLSSPASNTVIDKMDNYCNLRIAGHSVASIIGVQEFYDCTFHVNDFVLIPRPDTEIIVEFCINLINNNKMKFIADFGTGPGTIAVTVAKHCQGILIDAIDVSDEAISLLEENIKLNGIDSDLVKPILCDMREFTTDKKYDLIISNPPYIKKSVVRKIISNHTVSDPEISLDGGDDGLDFFRTLFSIASKYLKTGGYLVVEHGYDQAAELKELFTKPPFTYIECIKDYAGNDRVTVITLGTL